LWNNAHTAALEDYGLKEVVDGKVRCIIGLRPAAFRRLTSTLVNGPLGRIRTKLGIGLCQLTI
jgi:hypothetical protein